jgi:hypothetical protein
MNNRKLKFLLVALAIVSVVPLLLNVPFSINNANNSVNDTYDYRVLFPTASADELVDVGHHFKSRAMVGDAANDDGSFIVTDTYVDLESCEFCTRVQYTAGENGVAGFSYLDEKGFDLTNAKRVTFYAMGVAGDADVKFMVGGKNATMSDKGVFKNQKFAKSTKNFKLDNDWQFIEIDISGTDLKNITHPFAFEVKPAKKSGQIVFYIKSVFIDTQTANNPIPTE